MAITGLVDRLKKSLLDERVRQEEAWQRIQGDLQRAKDDTEQAYDDYRNVAGDLQRAVNSTKKALADYQDAVEKQKVEAQLEGEEEQEDRELAAEAAASEQASHAKQVNTQPREEVVEEEEDMHAAASVVAGVQASHGNQVDRQAREEVEEEDMKSAARAVASEQASNHADQVDRQLKEEVEEEDKKPVAKAAASEEARQQGAQVDQQLREDEEEEMKVAAKAADSEQAKDLESSRALALGGQAEPKARILQALLSGGALAEELDELLLELRAARGDAPPRAAPGSNTVGLRGGAWRLLGTASVKAPPRVEIFSGGHFLQDGSIRIIGLFDAIVAKQVAEVKLGVPEVRISNTSLKVSVDTVAAPPGRNKTLAYTAKLTALAPAVFQRSVEKLDLPQPIGQLKPLMRVSDIIEVIYADEDLLIVRDESGCSEFLVHESVRLLGKSDDVGVKDERFFQASVMA